MSNFFVQYLVSSGCIFTYIFSIAYYSQYNTKNYTLSYNDVFKLVYINLFVSLPVCVFSYFQLFSVNYYPYSTINEIFYMILSLFLISILFGLIHFCFHKNKYLYINYHVIHHKAIITKPIDSLYVHPVEFLLGMIFPVFFCIYTFNLSLIGIFIVMIISINENVKGHLTMKNASSCQSWSQHNYHHKLYNVNYDSYPYLLSKYVWKSYKDK